MKNNMNKDIILIGGAHIDIAGVPDHKLSTGAKNYGKVSFAAGGVAYNVAYNLGCLGAEPTLITIICDDANSQIVKTACAENHIDISQSLFLKNQSTPNYLFIADLGGDTHLGISDTSLYSEITPKFLQTKIDLINSYKVCFIDGNLSRDALEYLLTNVKIPTVADPVSVDHCSKLKDIIHLAHTIKPNEHELEALSGIAPSGAAALSAAKDYFVSSGVTEVFFSLGAKGLYYGDKNHTGHIIHPVENIITANGAGDSMTAGLIYGKLHNCSVGDMAKYGVAAACITLQSKTQDRKALSLNKLKEKTEEIK